MAIKRQPVKGLALYNVASIVKNFFYLFLNSFSAWKQAQQNLSMR